MREVPNLMPAPAVTHRAPTSSVGIGTGDIVSNNGNNEAENPLSENPIERENVFAENDASEGGVEPSPPPPICLEDNDIDMEDMETCNKFMKN